MFHNRSLSLGLALVFVVGGIASVASAQQGRPAQQPRPAQQQPQDGALRGPSVNDNAPPGERRFTGGDGQRRNQANAELPLPAFVRAFDVLRSDKTDAAVRLTPEQDKRIAAALDGFRDQVRDFREENKAEIDDIRAGAPPEMRRRIDAMLNAGDVGRPGQPGQPGQGRQGRPGQDRPADARPDENRPQRRQQDGAPPRGRPNVDGPDEMDGGRQPMNEADAQALRDRVRTLAEKAPKPTETQAQMLSVLTAAQKPIVQKEIDRLRTQMSQRRDGRGEGPGMTPPPGAGAPDFDESRLPEQMRERLRNMSPEQRRQAIERLRRQQRPE
jgi:hypothetical protein